MSRLVLTLAAAWACLAAAPAYPGGKVSVSAPSSGDVVGHNVCTAGWTDPVSTEVTVEVHFAGYVATGTRISDNRGDWTCNVQVPKSYAGPATVVVYLTADPSTAKTINVVVE